MVGVLLLGGSTYAVADESVVVYKNIPEIRHKIITEGHARAVFDTGYVSRTERGEE